MSEPLSKWASDDRSHHDRGVEAIIRRLLARGVATIVTLTGGLTGSAAFPSAPITGQAHWRTDTHCWYYWDGSKWNAAGVEVSGQVNFAPVQTINSTTFTDITNSNTTVTTLGAAIIEMRGWCRVDSATGGYYVRTLINGTAGPQDPYTDINTSSLNQPILGRVAVTAAGTYTIKAQAAMLGAATQCRVVGGFYNYSAGK